MAYKVHSTSKGKIPAIRCKACHDLPPIKSNMAIAREVEPLAAGAASGVSRRRPPCGNLECDNHSRPVGFHPKEYRKRGQPRAGGGHYYLCKRCGRRTLVSDPVRLHKDHRALAADILGRIANKSPVRGTCRGAGIKNTQSYYHIVDFLHGRCRAYSGAVDRAFIDGRLKLPADIDIHSDAQVYQLNWISRLDRRNVELSSYCSVHSASRFVLAMHFNFDGRVDAFEVNREAARNGDLDGPEAFREYAQYWLAGDELRAGRAMARRGDDKARIGLLRQIERLYAQAASRDDVENIELQYLNTGYATPFLAQGLQVHMPYTAYAHWLLLYRILQGAGVRQVRAGQHGHRLDGACGLSDRVRRRGQGWHWARFLRQVHEVPDHRRTPRDSRREQA